MFKQLFNSSLAYIQALGAAILLWINSCVCRVTVPLCSALLKQIGCICSSLLIVLLVAAIAVGIIIGLDAYSITHTYAAQSLLGKFVTAHLFSEISPLVVAVLFIICCGTKMTAQIGDMKQTQQLASLQMMNIDPQQYFLWPRLWASILVLPLLVLLFNLLALCSAALVNIGLLAVPADVFWQHIYLIDSIYDDIIGGLIKSAVFALVASWIAVFQGWTCQANQSGIMQAVRRGLVYATTAILLLDLLYNLMIFGK